MYLNLEKKIVTVYFSLVILDIFELSESVADIHAVTGN